jgi:phage tail sheath protein FI
MVPLFSWNISAMIRLICSILWRVLPQQLRGSFCSRNYVNNLERSLEWATRFAATEPNGEELWARVRRTIKESLFKEWKRGSLLGKTPEQAYQVRCDRTTMTQNDLDNGRLICVIGIAPTKPAEFVIIRIGQWTAHKPDP